jgi:predicted metalloprotease
VQQGPAAGPPASDEMGRFVSTVLADTEDVWREQFRASGETYREPKLVLFSGQFPTACGMGQAAMGPFYCPGDQKVYIDLRFYEVMRTRMGAPGDFAQAYVIAHEVGHHVQNLMGITGKVDSMRGRVPEAQMNALSVRVELQADCLAGVWAHHSNQRWNSLEPGDVEAALQTAAAIGDDRLQQQSRGHVVPDSFTHGSSAQRQRWFTIGLKEGKVSACNTFSATTL